MKGDGGGGGGGGGGLSLIKVALNKVIWGGEIFDGIYSKMEITFYIPPSTLSTIMPGRVVQLWSIK